MRKWVLSTAPYRRLPVASLVIAGLAGLMACSDATAPEDTPAIVSKAVVDGAHGGHAGFFFLPPLSPMPGGTGIFDPSQVGRLTVEICAIQNSQCAVPAVTTFSAISAEPVVVDTAAERYAITWRTAQHQLTPGTDYRVRVLIDAVELGHADFDLLPAGAASGAVGLRNGDPLPISFRIDEGAVDTTGIRVAEGTGATGLTKNLVVTVTPASSIEVEYWTAGETRWRLGYPFATSHNVLLARLLPGRSYNYLIRADAPELSGATAQGTFTSEPLPTDLGAVVFQATGAPTAPLVMLEIRQPTFQGFVAVDDQSRVVWHYGTTGSPWSWARRNNGNFVLLDTGEEIQEITPGGKVVSRVQRDRTLNQVIHHDVIATPGNTFYFLTREPRLFGSVSWTGEGIWEWDPATDQVVQRWSAMDFLSPSTDVGPRSRTGDWIHANALHVGVSGNVLMSSPFLNQVIAIRPDWSGLSWRLGGVNATITVDSAGTFDFQHTAAEIANGRVLMFDNRRDNLHDGQAYSRALELAVDHSTNQATMAWQFRPPNDNYSTIISSARRMVNGNTMVAFGAGDGLRGSVGPIEVYEVTPGGAVVWNLVITGPSSMYRATPFDHIAGEVAAN